MSRSEDHSMHRQRMRQRFAQTGLDGFADHEILELLLFFAIRQIDVNPLAHALLNKFGTLNKVFSATPQELMKVHGVGEQTSHLLCLVGAVHKHLLLKQNNKTPILDTPAKIATYAHALLSNQKTEYFYAILLGARQQLLHTTLISQGAPSTTTVHPRLVVEAALRHGADYVVLAHNHPGGENQPSPADIEVTRIISTALGAIDIKCPEHIIVARDSTYSIISRTEYTSREIALSQSQGVLPPEELAQFLASSSQNTAQEWIVERPIDGYD